MSAAVNAEAWRARRRSRLLTTAVSLCLLWGCSPERPRVPPWNCGRVASELIGPEDFALDTTGPDGPRLIVSARAGRATDPSDKNGIWSVAIADPQASPTPLKEASPIPLKVEGRGTGDCSIPAPHGIALATRVPGDPGLRLFVINEKSCLGQENPCRCPSGLGGYSIERYRVERDKLVFEERYASDLLLRPNDLDVSADGSELYVSNAQASSREWLRNVDRLFQIPSGNVVRGVRRSPGRAAWTIADDGLNYANGVALDQDRNRLYVAELYRDWVRVYDVKRSCTACGDTLVRVGVIRIGSGPDNLTWEDAGKTRMYVAAHASVWRFARHYSSGCPSPSEAYLVDNLDAVPTVRPVYADDGRRFSAASTALEYEGRLFLGEALDGGLLACKLEPAASNTEPSRWRASEE